MDELPPEARVLARRLLRVESGGREEPEALAAAIDRAAARLRGRLAGLVGQHGYAALCGRAVRLAQREAPHLAGVTYDARPPGGLRGTHEFVLANAGDPAAAGDALASILAQLIGLLIAFIGQDLTVRLIHETWPELARGDAGPEGRT